jgi:hypothetical protein
MAVVVPIEMWPGGVQEKRRTIGCVVIVLTGGDNETGHYDVSLFKSGEYAKPGNVGKPWRKGKVRDFPRLRLGPYDLLFQALAACCGDRSPAAAAKAAAGETLGGDTPRAAGQG